MFLINEEKNISKVIYQAAQYKFLYFLISLPVTHHKSSCYVDRVSGETSNDRNDASIRLSAWWYNSRVKGLGISVVLLTDDLKCREKASEMNINTYSGGLDFFGKANTVIVAILY